MVTNPITHGFSQKKKKKKKKRTLPNILKLNRASNTSHFTDTTTNQGIEGSKFRTAPADKAGIFCAGGWTSIETRMIRTVLNTRVFRPISAISTDFGAFCCNFILNRYKLKWVSRNFLLRHY